MPDHGLNRSDHEYPKYDADHRDRCQDPERPVEVPCALDHKSGDCRSYDPRKIADAALKACPSPGRFGPGESLRDGKQIGSGDANSNDAQDDKNDATGWSADRGEEEGDA